MLCVEPDKIKKNFNTFCEILSSPRIEEDVIDKYYCREQN